MYLIPKVKISEDQIPDYIRRGEDRKVIPLLYKKVLPLVENYVSKRSGRKEDAYDAFQDALMVFYKQVIKGSFDPKYKVFGYLYRLSLNYWINRVKKENRIQLKEELEETGVEVEDLPEIRETLVAAGDRNLLQTVFAGIGEKCIELLTYSVYYNLLMEDIMLRMSLPSVSAVKMQQQRCKQKLMKEIEKNPLLIKKLKER